eukprot:365876-Chlamydomonas_euryale.AAC.7
MPVFDGRWSGLGRREGDCWQGAAGRWFACQAIRASTPPDEVAHLPGIRARFVVGRAEHRTRKWGGQRAERSQLERTTQLAHEHFRDAPGCS